MTLKREDIKKLVINQMLQEGFLDSIRQKMFSKSGASQASKNPNKKIEGVADFLQQAQRSKELTALVSNTKVGQAAGFKPEDTQKQVEEALGMNLVSQIRKAGITDADLDAFIAEMSKNTTAKKILAGLGLTSQDAPQAQQGQQQTQQPQAAQAGGQQKQPAAAQPEAGADDVIAVFKGKTKGPKGASDSLHTQLTRQFGTKVPDGGKLITAISKDLMNQLKANGLKVQESVEQIENFLLKEMVNGKISKDSLSVLLREELTEDYEIAGDVLSVLMEAGPDELQRARELGFKTPKEYKAALEKWKKENNYNEPDAKTKFKDSILKQKTAAGEAALQKDAETASIMASDKEGKNIPPVEEPEQKNDSTVPQPADEVPTSGPQQVGALAGRQQQISKAADAAFKQITPTRPGIVNVGEVVGRKLKAIAQLNAKAGQALVPMVPKMLQAIEKFIGFALAKSGKKDSVKIVGGSKNAAALQKTLTNIKSKGIMKGPQQSAKPAIQKEQLQEAIVEEIFNLLTGKIK